MASGYEVLKPLGRGGQGCVKLVRRRGTWKRFACKTMRLDEAMEEARIIRRLRHTEGIVRVEEVVMEGDRGHIILELCDCSLHDHIQRKGRLTVEETAELTMKLARAIQGMHAMGVVHCDLKPQNVLLKFDPHNRSEYEVKIADFGLAEVCFQPVQTWIRGTPRYMAPEMARRGQCSEGADMWGLAMVVFEALTGRMPYKNMSDKQALKMLTEADECRNHPILGFMPLMELTNKWRMPRGVEAFLENLMHPDPNRRIKPHQIVRVEEKSLKGM